MSIYPAHEYLLEENIENTIKKIREKYKNEEDIEQIKAGNYISKIDKYFDCFYNIQETLLDYLNNDYIIFLDEINKITLRANNIKKDKENLIKNLIEKKE